MTKVGMASGQGGSPARATGRLALLIRRFGNKLFQAEEARARQHGWQITANRGERASGTQRVVLLFGDGRQDFGVVGGAGFVSGLGGQGQPLLQVSCRADHTVKHQTHCHA